MAGPNGNGNGESSGGGEEQPFYGGTMVHESNKPEGGTETGAVANEGQIVDLDENPLYDETNPVFQFRSGVLGLKADQMKIVLYTIGGYFLYTRFIK